MSAAAGIEQTDAVVRQSAPDVDAALRTRGVALLRGLLPDATVDALRAQVVARFAERDVAVREGELAADHPAVRHDSFLLDDFRERTGDDGPFEQLCARVRPLLAVRLGSELAVLGHESRIKRQRGIDASSLSPFHQDPTFVGTDRPFVIAWIPLDPCGEDAPGLEIVPRPLDRVLPVVGRGGPAANPNYAHIEVTADALAEVQGDAAAVRPVFAPGDVCLLDAHTVHRTFATPTMDRTRLAVVLRFVPAG